MNMKKLWIAFTLCAILFAGCTPATSNQSLPHASKPPTPTNKTKQQAVPEPSKQAPVSRTPDLQDGPENQIRKPHPMTLSDLQAKYRSTFLLSGSSDKREIALTFDDAPDDQFTPQVLDILKKEGVRATFFVVGNRVQAHPEIVRRMVKEGHVIGNHSWDHPNLPKLRDAEFRRQILKTDQQILPITGYLPTFVRPPYGNISEDQILWLASQHKVIVNWDVDSLDWKGLSAEEVKTNVLAHIHPGAIVLQHSAGGKGQDLSGTVQALPDIIRAIRSDGVKLVTIPELLDMQQGR